MNDKKETFKIITPTPANEDGEDKKKKINHDDYDNREIYAIQDNKVNPVKLIIVLAILGAIIYYIVTVTIPAFQSTMNPKPTTGYINILK